MPESGPSRPAAISDMDSREHLLLLAAVIIAAAILFCRRKDRRIQRLISGGNFVLAEITGCDGSFLVNGKSYCCFRAKWRDDSGAEHEFLSDAVRSHKVHGQTGCKVRVYLTEGSFEDYYVDPDSIGKET